MVHIATSALKCTCWCELTLKVFIFFFFYLKIKRKSLHLWKYQQQYSIFQFPSPRSSPPPSPPSFLSILIISLKWSKPQTKLQFKLAKLLPSHRRKKLSIPELSFDPAESHGEYHTKRLINDLLMMKLLRLFFINNYNLQNLFWVFILAFFFCHFKNIL